jgi:hypothetical protein
VDLGELDMCRETQRSSLPCLTAHLTGAAKDVGYHRRGQVSISYGLFIRGICKEETYPSIHNNPVLGYPKCQQTLLDGQDG